jgi:LAO/AO transport system kinase
LRVLDAVGCDVVLIETVGVGQSEVEVVQLADTTVVLLAPGMGDGIQAAKAGILEIADVFVVNKADREGADQVARDLRYMLSLGGKHSAAGAWRPPIVKTVAARGEGVEDLVGAIDKHRDWMLASGELQRRRQARAGSEVEAIAVETVRRRFSEIHGAAALEELAARVADGRLDPYAAADELVASLPA